MPTPAASLEASSQDAASKDALDKPPQASRGGRKKKQQQQQTPVAPTPTNLAAMPPPQMYRASSGAASRPVSTRVIPGQSLGSGRRPSPPPAQTVVGPGGATIPPPPIHLLNHAAPGATMPPASWTHPAAHNMATQQPYPPPYPFQPMPPAPNAMGQAPYPSPMLGTAALPTPLLAMNWPLQPPYTAAVGGTMPPQGKRRKSVGKGKPPQSQGARRGKTSPVDGRGKVGKIRKRGRPIGSCAKRKSSTTTSALIRQRKRTLTIKDDFPNRIVNPLLDLPQFPTTPNPPPDYIPNGAELYKWSELCQTRPDTFPVSFYARLLGFQVATCAPPHEPMVELHPETVVRLTDNVWNQVPPEGTFANLWRNLSEKKLLDYQDPVYRDICQSYRACNLTPSATGASMVKAQETACLEFAQTQDVIDKNWTFVSCCPTDMAHVQKLLNNPKELQLIQSAIKNPGEFVILAKHNLIPKGLIHYKFQWYRIQDKAQLRPPPPQQQQQQSSVANAIAASNRKHRVSELVFSIEQVYCPETTNHVVLPESTINDETMDPRKESLTATMAAPSTEMPFTTTLYTDKDATKVDQTDESAQISEAAAPNPKMPCTTADMDATNVIQTDESSQSVVEAPTAKVPEKLADDKETNKTQVASEQVVPHQDKESQDEEPSAPSGNTAAPDKTEEALPDKEQSDEKVGNDSKEESNLATAETLGETSKDSGEKSGATVVATEKENAETVVPEHCLTDPAAIVLTALALEHAKSCNIWYGISQVPESSASWFQDYFRMSRIDQQDCEAKAENDSPKSTPMVCDLQKCNYRYAFLMKRERKRSCGAPSKGAETLAAPNLRERMLVRFPNVVEASACLENPPPGFAKQPQSRSLGLARPLQSPFFSSADEKMRGISFGIRASLPTPESPPLELYCLEDQGNKQGNIVSTSSFKSDPRWDVLRVFPMQRTASTAVNKTVQEEGQDNEILSELCKKQKQLASMEGGFEPNLRSLLSKVIEERKAFEHPDAVKEREARKKTLKDYQTVLERRREVDRAWQKQLEQDMDAVCDICSDGEVTPDNQILFCEACNVAVHQMCYGVEKVPEGDYYCLACRYFDREKMTQAVARQLERGAAAPRMAVSALPICCELCPRKQGAFYRTDTSRLGKDGKPEESSPVAAKWVHVLCAKWQGLGFQDGDNKVVENVADYKESFRCLYPRPRCTLCQGNRGAFNQCRHEGCSKWLHVSCARATGLCTVTHGENALGPVSTNPWTLCCPEHSDIAPQDVPEGSVTVEQLVQAAKEFPLEPDPPPPKPRPPRFNKMTGKERKKFLADPEYEREFLYILTTERLHGVRCEVCHQCEQDGNNLTRCQVCDVVFCDSCVLPTDGVEKGKDYVCLPCRFMEEKKELEEDCPPPQCHMCYQKGGWMREGFAKPVNRKGYWTRNPKEFEKTMFNQKLWNHPLCTMWQNERVVTDEEGRVDCSSIIMSNGRCHILGKNNCGLCCQTGGLKVKCDVDGCRDLGLMEGASHVHVTCARQAGLEVKDRVGDYGYYEFYANCFRHSGEEFAFRAKLEDLIELERQRTGKKLTSTSLPMSLAHASRLFHASIRVMHSLGWAWRWAEWWVQYGDNWEPLLEPGQIESKMTKEQLKIVDSTPQSRCEDARRCRLSALGAALRNRSFDVDEGDDRVALDKALRAVLHTKSLVGPLTQVEIDFFADWLARAYRSKSRVLGYGDDKIPVSAGGKCCHVDDGSPKYELGSRPLPGKQELPEGQVFESGVTEVDDFLKPIKLSDGTEVSAEEMAERQKSAKPRKRSAEEVSTPSKKGKKGRKKKKSTNNDEEPRVKRSPGRPRKSSSTEQLPSTPGQKRRGRPPKSSVSGRKPGRPRKSQLAEYDAEEDNLVSPQTSATGRKRKGRPGRPRKNPLPQVEEDEDFEFPAENLPKKRGRPSLQPYRVVALVGGEEMPADASPAQRRRPGRPRKRKVVSEAQQGEDYGDAEELPKAEADSVENLPKKRGRRPGRPRKVKAPLGAEEVKQEVDQEEARGNPSNVTESVVTQAEESESPNTNPPVDEDVEEGTSLKLESSVENPPRKRGRRPGRPRKAVKSSAEERTEPEKEEALELEDTGSVEVPRMSGRRRKSRMESLEEIDEDEDFVEEEESGEGSDTNLKRVTSMEDSPRKRGRRPGRPRKAAVSSAAEQPDPETEETLEREDTGSSEIPRMPSRRRKSRMVSLAEVEEDEDFADEEEAAEGSEEAYMEEEPAELPAKQGERPPGRPKMGESTEGQLALAESRVKKEEDDYEDDELVPLSQLKRRNPKRSKI